MNVPPRVVIGWRKPGGRKPDGVIVCSRPSRWGNPWRVEEYGDKRKWYRVLDSNGNIVKGSQCPNKARVVADCLWLYRVYLEEMLKLDPAFLDPLRTATGLACWCPLDQRCHVDVIREMMK